MADTEKRVTEQTIRTAIAQTRAVSTDLTSSVNDLVTLVEDYFDEQERDG